MRCWMTGASGWLTMNPNRGKQDNKRQPVEALAAAFCAGHPQPGESPSQRTGDHIIRPAAGMHRQPGFAISQASERLRGCLANGLGRHIAQDEKSARVGMPRQGFAREVPGENVNRGVFQSVVAAGGQDNGRVQKVGHFLLSGLQVEGGKVRSDYSKKHRQAPDIVHLPQFCTSQY